ncbi:acetolactate decarboxylase [Methanoplanus endosymbiosus]|uniref:Alpha-acetolactate decarboxylase n=1 Tax=Methanoplanus endosymbiosus TaxID=33865 RepID=A0A9E7TIF7_9EURY|nr:acetolactate decarboxylase [Methanoplanus endosymbiosus]UUX92383.1 acetolactate decarboxylase [Methanoplanus endosymbiosus]
MNKNYILGFVFAVALIFFIFSALSYDPSANNDDSVYVFSPLEKLLKGDYNGTSDYSDVMLHGDTGLGTFDRLNGEMVAVDGEYYQVFYNGTVGEVSGSQTASFAEVKEFSPDIAFALESPVNYSGMKELLKGEFESDSGLSVVYAVRLDGYFREVKTRSVKEQSEPYRPLEDVLSTGDQAFFERTGVKGTAVGYYHPSYMKDLTSEGFHLHFISDDRKFGGHLVEFNMDSGVISADRTEKVVLRTAKE